MKNILVVLVIMFLASCSNGLNPSSKNDFISQPSKQAITEISQTLNISQAKLLPAIVGILKQRGIESTEIDPSNGTVKTVSLSMREKHCSSTTVPLDCHTHYLFEIAPLSDVASSFSVQYFEECESYGFGNLECPDSKAERLMIDIVNEIKSVAGVVSAR